MCLIIRFFCRRYADQVVELGKGLGVPAGLRGPHPLRDGGANQPQGQQHLRLRLTGQDREGVAAGLRHP